MNIGYWYNAFERGRFPLPTPEEVENAERLAAVKFPVSFREYLLNYNGGYFLNPTIPFPDSQFPDDGLEVLYGINATSSASELCHPSNLRLLENNDPRIILPIGYTVGGALLSLATDVENAGEILYKLPSREGFHVIADDIYDFFELLRDDNV